MSNTFDLSQAEERALLSECLTQLLSLANCTNGREQSKRIPLARVLSFVWNQGRLLECRTLLAAGEKAPAIYVTQVWLAGCKMQNTYYLVSDGNHRAEAAREAGITSIRAKVGGGYKVEAGKLAIWQEQVWKAVGFGEWQCMTFGKLPDNIVQGLIRLGLRQRIL